MTPQEPTRDRGGVTVEFGVMLPLTIFIILLCFQALIFSTTAESVENAARAGARAASKAQNPAECFRAANAAKPRWSNGPVIIRPSMGSSAHGPWVSCQVIARAPFFWPGIPFEPKPINRTVKMPFG